MSCQKKGRDGVNTYSNKKLSSFFLNFDIHFKGRDEIYAE
jgi:hypothetical protein